MGGGALLNTETSVAQVLDVMSYRTSVGLYLSRLAGSQLGASCPWALAYCYLEFKLHYLKEELQLLPQIAPKSVA